jgi:mRNA interferase RelE/StbE
VNVTFRSSFLKDIKKIKDKKVNELVLLTISEVKSAKSIKNIPKIERLVSRQPYYKIKKHPYRFGLYIENSEVEFVKFGTRQNFYRDFPP